ncbi:MAG TPA: hypothetical protein PLQ88_30920, partial [Blastocatellia bacterium]|nr:hypothetical protein [Blastocatellia bacterium]
HNQCSFFSSGWRDCFNAGRGNFEWKAAARQSEFVVERGINVRGELLFAARFSNAKAWRNFGKRDLTSVSGSKRL